MSIRQYILNSILIPLCFACCTKEIKKSAIEDDDQHLQQQLSQFRRIKDLNELIDQGLYNLAFHCTERVQTKLSEKEKMGLVFKFAENGEFDKAKAVSAKISSLEMREKQLRFRLLSALNRQDTTLASALFDTLNHNFPLLVSPLDQATRKLDRAYLEHNRKNYEVAIALNDSVLKQLQKSKIENDLMATVYHRLGNNYNDIARDRLAFSESRDICLKKAVDFYRKELCILQKLPHKNSTKIGLNYITTAMVLRGAISPDSLQTYYRIALQKLFLQNENGFLHTKNPVYTSIAFLHLAGIYFEKKQETQLDSVLMLNEKLIAIRTLCRIQDKQSMDVLEYFPQRGPEMKQIYEAVIKTNSSKTGIRLLNLSNKSKYPNMALQELLKQKFGDQAQLAVRNWVLLNELSIFNKNKTNPTSSSWQKKKLNDYSQLINDIIEKKQNPLSTTDLTKLQDYCRRENAAIVDYQIHYNGGLIICTIDERGVLWDFKTQIVKPIKDLINELFETGKQNDLKNYVMGANKLYQHLGLNHLSAKNILICPDEQLEKLAFDALTADTIVSETWSDINFLGRTKCVRLVPNLTALLRDSKNNPPLTINIWSSDEANETLPYNRKVIKELADKYDGRVNQTATKEILHIISHTTRSSDNSIEFRLNTTTLTVHSNASVKPAMAVLQGCSSGMGEIYKQEGSISLTRCFLYNGTPSVIYAIWEADNQASAELFISFYEALQKNNSTSKSLQQAKLKLLQDPFHPEWANPLYWSNFQLTGADFTFKN